MAAIRSYRTASGRMRHVADYQDARRGIARAKRSFDTRAEARAWLAACDRAGAERLLGQRPRHTFGEALARYLLEETPHKRSAGDDHSNANALRWPVRQGTRWLRLDALPLEPRVAGEETIVHGMRAWLVDQRAVTRRARVAGELYQERDERWWHQPMPRADRPAPTRTPVSSAELLDRLERAHDRGPFSANTLRARQSLVHRVLRLAWDTWEWTEQDLSGRIKLAPRPTVHGRYYTPEQVERICAKLAPPYNDFIRALALLGFREANLRALTWAQVHMPAPGQRGGWIELPADATKNRQPLAVPLSQHVEALLGRRLTCAIGPLVFQLGGRPLGNFRKRLLAAMAAAGVEPLPRLMHTFRHTCASHLAAAGATDRELQALLGWSDARMAHRYAHLRTEDLADVVRRRDQRL